MELNNIYEIWDRFETSSATELSLELQGVRLCLKKQPGAAGSRETEWRPSGYPEAAEAGETEKTGPESRRNQAEQPTGKTEGGKTAEVTEIRSPLVGTFYRGAAPDAEPFVKEGQQVQKGDVIGIIEAMKLMNEVTATASGRIEKIMAEDGGMVEYNQVLLTIK